jgi:hypothetical protein
MHLDCSLGLTITLKGWGMLTLILPSERVHYDLQRVISQLQTSRLFLRPLMLADAQQTQLLFPHWEIVRYLSNVVPWPYPPDGAYTHYRDAALPAMERGDAWHWTLRLRLIQRGSSAA